MSKETPNRYTCNEYREEMTLVGLRRHLARTDISESERVLLLAEIEKLEARMGLN